MNRYYYGILYHAMEQCKMGWRCVEKNDFLRKFEIYECESIDFFEKLKVLKKQYDNEWVFNKICTCLMRIIHGFVTHNTTHSIRFSQLPCILHAHHSFHHHKPHHHSTTNKPLTSRIPIVYKTCKNKNPLNFFELNIELHKWIVMCKRGDYLHQLPKNPITNFSLNIHY